MKKNHFKLTLLLAACIFSFQSFAQAPRHNLLMDVKLDKFLQDNITSDPCGNNQINISFDVINKKANTVAICELNFEVLSTEADFNITSPATCETGVRCIKLDPGQTKRIHATATILNSWAEMIAPSLIISATPYNTPGGSITFSETVTLDNTLNETIQLADAITGENSFCICNRPGTSQVDTSGMYIIQEYIKKSPGPLPISSATLAIPFNLRPVLSRTDAARFKFRSAGFYNGDQRLPMYTIEFAESNLFVTKDNNLVILRYRDASNSQKWLLKQNGLGGFGIFSYAEPGRRCYAWGTPLSMPPAANSVLLLRPSYEATNIFQSFTLVKVQQ